MNQIILHNYPQSPVAEKVRVALGVKGLAWNSVEIPRIPPKPDLIPLTGGYRRTPVMQIGADVYCDSQCILRELERRFPEPTFFPDDSDGLGWVISRWSDHLFNDTVKLVLGSVEATLPEDFAQDRGRLYFGADWKENLKRAGRDMPHIATQIRGQMAWLDNWLETTGNSFFLGQRPGLADISVYYLLWFIRGRWEKGPDFLSQFTQLTGWETLVREIGHGSVSDFSADSALDIARQSTPEKSEKSDLGDAQGLVQGMQVKITPDVDGGEVDVSGTIESVSSNTISLRHEDERTGIVCVHFPRVGYRIET